MSTVIDSQTQGKTTQTQSCVWGVGCCLVR